MLYVKPYGGAGRRTDRAVTMKTLTAQVTAHHTPHGTVRRDGTDTHVTYMYISLFSVEERDPRATAPQLQFRALACSEGRGQRAENRGQGRAEAVGPGL